MRSIISRGSGAASSVIDDLKVLLELISKPAEFKELIKELDGDLKKSEAAKKELAAKEASMAEEAQALEAKKAELEKLALPLAEQKQLLAEKEKMLIEKQSLLHSLEKSLKQKEVDLGLKVGEEMQAISARSAAVGEKLVNAQKLEAEAKALISEYESKLVKLKAAMGA